MARTARLKSSTGIYHVMMRGINRQDIFFDDIDRDRFLDFVQSAISHPVNFSGRPAGKFEVYAYALMGNHIHMLVRVESGELSEFVKKIAAGYVKYFNKRYNRDGHLFRERFRSEPSENFDYFCIVFGYIHQNPVKHGFSKNVEDYKYTSWSEYFAPESAHHHICNVEYVSSKMPTSKIKEIIDEMVPLNAKCIDIDRVFGKIPDESIIKYLKEKYGIDSPFEIKGLKREERREIIKDLLDFGGAVRQISRLTGLDKMTISHLK